MRLHTSLGALVLSGRQAAAAPRTSLPLWSTHYDSTTSPPSPTYDPSTNSLPLLPTSFPSSLTYDPTLPSIPTFPSSIPVSSPILGISSAPAVAPPPLPTFPTQSFDLFSSPPPKVINHGHIFKTEPEFRQESFDIMYMTNDTSLLAPGYIFMTPYPGRDPWGAQIYDMYGNLVFHSGAHHKTQDFKACDYLGSMGDHLCWHDRTRGNAKRVMDNTYTFVRDYRTNIVRAPPNGHEFNMLPGGESFLQAVVKRDKLDYKDNFHQEEGGTVVLDGCFQEVDCRTGNSVFAWCGLQDEHVYVWDTTLNVDIKGQKNRTSWKAGKGTEKKPWDYFHVNSADKYDGDYLVSARHLDQILKVAGPDNKHGVKPGTVLWRLGGKRNQFARSFNFSKQHAIRFLSVNATETVMSILDNAWEGTNEPSADKSSGKVIKINNETMTAELLYQYDHPQSMNAEGQGGAQVLPNNNMFVGWGRIPDVSEYAQDGTLLYYARFETRKHNRSDHLNIMDKPMGESSYRSVKHPWVGWPKTRPKLLAIVDRDEPCLINAYMSWNGATEVTDWRISTALTDSGPWTVVKKIKRSGFESSTCIPDPASGLPFLVTFWVRTQALDKHGKILGTKKIMVNFPNTGIIGLAILIVGIEAFSAAYSLVMYYMLGSRIYLPLSG